MDFTQTQVQSYRKPLPEKSKILKQSCFYAISYLFCSQHLCKYKLTANNFHIAVWSQTVWSGLIWEPKCHKNMAKWKDCVNSEENTLEA